MNGLVMPGKTGKLLPPSGLREDTCQTTWGLEKGAGEQICPGG